VPGPNHTSKERKVSDYAIVNLLEIEDSVQGRVPGLEGRFSRKFLGSGLSVEAYLEQSGPPVTPEIAGTALVELVRADAANVASAYLLTGAGLQELP
jgi:hypothetical protein